MCMQHSVVILLLLDNHFVDSSASHHKWTVCIASTYILYSVQYCINTHFQIIISCIVRMFME